MEYVLTDNGNIKVTDGKPTVVSDGKEVAIDAIGAHDRLKPIIQQRDQLKGDLQAANTTLETFVGIDDPAAAIKAMQDIASIGDTQQAELDTLRTEINTAWEVKQTAWETDKTNLSTSLRAATIERDFATSATIANLTIPSDIAYVMFGRQFNDDGTANDSSGNPIYSLENPGKLASGEEAINIVLNAYPMIDKITKAGNSGGGGNGGGESGGGPGTITRTEFDALSDTAKMKFSTDGGKII